MHVVFADSTKIKVLCPLFYLVGHFGRYFHLHNDSNLHSLKFMQVLLQLLYYFYKFHFWSLFFIYDNFFFHTNFVHFIIQSYRISSASTLSQNICNHWFTVVTFCIFANQVYTMVKLSRIDHYVFVIPLWLSFHDSIISLLIVSQLDGIVM